jgi:acylphosphatase
LGAWGTEHRIGLREDALGVHGVVQNLQEGQCEHRRARLVAGEEERLELVAQLLLELRAPSLASGTLAQQDEVQHVSCLRVASISGPAHGHSSRSNATTLSPTIPQTYADLHTGGTYCAFLKETWLARPDRE